jgi:arylsulfatase A-like enzyme
VNATTRRIPIALLAWLAGVGLACQPRAPAPPANLVFILIDTLRADHLGSYGYARDTTPRIDELAREGVVFESAIAQASWTHPSMASLFTSRYAVEFGADAIYVPLPDEALTLGELLQAEGFETVGVLTNPHMHPSLGITQGLDRHHLELNAPADWVIDRAIEELDRLDANAQVSRFFLYLHFMDVHSPLEPPAPYDAMFAASDGQPHEKRHRVYRAPPRVHRDPAALDRFRSHSLALYDGALRYTDDQIGRLLDHMRDRGRMDDTLIVVVSDHGESHWENLDVERRLALSSSEKRRFAGVGHGLTLFPELIRLPWILRAPGIPPRRVSQQVRGLDVAPTILAALGVTSDAFDPLGIDVLSAARRGTLEDLPALSRTVVQELPQVSLRQGGLQIVRVRETDHLFEWNGVRLVDVTSERGDALSSMASDLDEAVASIEAGEAMPVRVPQEVRDALRALGYVDDEGGDSDVEREARAE